jgi:hypothetical protein
MSSIEKINEVLEMISKTQFTMLCEAIRKYTDIDTAYILVHMLNKAKYEDNKNLYEVNNRWFEFTVKYMDTKYGINRVTAEKIIKNLQVNNIIERKKDFKVPNKPRTSAIRFTDEGVNKLKSVVIGDQNIELFNIKSNKSNLKNTDCQQKQKDKPTQGKQIEELAQAKPIIDEVKVQLPEQEPKLKPPADKQTETVDIIRSIVKEMLDDEIIKRTLQVRSVDSKYKKDFENNTNLKILWLLESASYVYINNIKKNIWSKYVNEISLDTAIRKSKSKTDKSVIANQSSEDKVKNYISSTEGQDFIRNTVFPFLSSQEFLDNRYRSIINNKDKFKIEITDLERIKHEQYSNHDRYDLTKSRELINVFLLECSKSPYGFTQKTIEINLQKIHNIINQHDLSMSYLSNDYPTWSKEIDIQAYYVDSYKWISDEKLFRKIYSKVTLSAFKPSELNQDVIIQCIEHFIKLEKKDEMRKLMAGEKHKIVDYSYLLE